MAEQMLRDSQEVASYSHVKAKDVIMSFNWRQLRKDIEDMLTQSRNDILKRNYNLIDSHCNSKINAQLTSGDPAAAASTLLDYFERNHSGDDLLRFCEFLRDEAEEAVRGAALKNLADRIERAIKDLGAPQGPIPPPNPPSVESTGTPSTRLRGVKKGRKRSPQHGSSSSKRKEPSSDSEESDSSASSKSSEDKTKKRGSKSTKRSRSYSEVTVRDVIRGMTREELHSGIKKMLTKHRTNLLCDDWELINEECRDDILGDLEANNKTMAANRLIDYFHDNHTGEELLHFCEFLTKEAKKAGRNAQLLKLTKAIKEAVHDAYASSGTSGASK